MPNPATVDVLMPVYNCEKYIAEALSSILKQTYPLEKIIILDDGSEDKTVEIIQSFNEPKIILLTSESNKGIVYQLNRGIKISKSKYIARMDGDDICFHDRIEKQVQYLENNTECVACSGSFYKTDGEGKLIKKVKAQNHANNPFLIPAYQHFLLHPFLMVNTNILKTVGGYHNVLYCEDADLYYRLQTHGRLHNLNDYLGEYRRHELSPVKSYIQALHSQLMALHLRKYQIESYAYYQSQPTTFYTNILNIEPNISNFLNLAMNSFDLTHLEQKWLQVAMTVKFIQNLTTHNYMCSNREIDSMLYSLTLALWSSHIKYEERRKSINTLFNFLANQQKAIKTTSQVKLNLLKIWHKSLILRNKCNLIK